MLGLSRPKQTKLFSVMFYCLCVSIIVLRHYFVKQFVMSEKYANYK